MDDFVFKVVWAWHSVRLFCGSLCRKRRTHTEYESFWLSLSDEGLLTDLEEPKFDNEHPFVLEMVARIRIDGREDMRYAVLHRDKERAKYTNESLFEHVVPPWLMICCDGKDKTELLSAYVAKGNLITLDLLNKLFYTEGEWTYVDPKTFEERKFPSCGILI
jgi:hypothetical protein